MYLGNQINFANIIRKSFVYAIAAASLIFGHAHAQQLKYHTILETDRYQIVMRTKTPLQQWCKKMQQRRVFLFVKYQVEHSQRDRIFGSDYKTFAEKKVFPALKRMCGAGPARSLIVLNMFKKGEKEAWDRFAFWIRDGRVAKSKQMPIGAAKKYKSVHAKTKPGQSRRLGKTEMWGIVCEGRPFCELAGGLYLKAIYENDILLLRRLDKRVNAFIRNKLRVADAQSGMGKVGLGLGQAFTETSLLPGLTDKYMHDYKKRGGRCLASNARTVTYTYKVKPTHWQTFSGMYAGTTGGYNVTATYTVNPEFYPLLKKLGNHLGGSWWRQTFDTLGSRAAAVTFEGLGGLQRRYRCDSPEIKQFERNLIQLTERYLKKPKAWLSGI